MRELTWMDDALEEANWKIAKWMLASIELCRTFEASKNRLDPESWNIPERERRFAEKEAERQRAEYERHEAANDPEKLAAFKAARIAEFNRFRSQIRP